MTETKPITLTEDDFGTLCICAIRYCHGRQTYMPSLVQGIVTQHLDDLSDKDVYVLLQDCDFQEQFHLFGDDRVDKPNWLKYRAIIEVECDKRGIRR